MQYRPVTYDESRLLFYYSLFDRLAQTVWAPPSENTVPAEFYDRSAACLQMSRELARQAQELSGTDRSHLSAEIQKECDTLLGVIRDARGEPSAKIIGEEQKDLCFRLMHRTASLTLQGLEQLAPEGLGRQWNLPQSLLWTSVADMGAVPTLPSVTQAYPPLLSVGNRMQTGAARILSLLSRAQR